MKTISQGKLAAFAVGQQKKSRFQKAREEKEQKKRQEEEEAAKVHRSNTAERCFVLTCLATTPSPHCL